MSTTAKHNEPGNKEYTCVVVQTQSDTLEYCSREGLYFPSRGSKYKILNELPMRKMREVCGDNGPGAVGFVAPDIKERVLEYCKLHPETKSGFNYNLFPYAMR
jgi:hypothetical protein